jgi:hypothetical protein
MAVPFVARPRTTTAQLVRVLLPEPVAPGPDRLIGHVDTTFEHQLLHVAEAQREPVLQRDTMADDLGWKPEPFIRRACSGHDRRSCPTSPSRLTNLTVPSPGRNCPVSRAICAKIATMVYILCVSNLYLINRTDVNLASVRCNFEDRSIGGLPVLRAREYCRDMSPRQEESPLPERVPVTGYLADVRALQAKIPADPGICVAILKGRLPSPRCGGHRDVRPASRRPGGKASQAWRSRCVSPQSSVSVVDQIETERAPFERALPSPH